MKQNTKGFTLIELLAVIVILAIIALIATPIILNMIDDARKSAAKDSAYAYLDAAETYIAMNMMYQTSGGAVSSEYKETVTDGTCNVDGSDCAWVAALNKTVKGTKPMSGTITVAGSKITGVNLAYDKEASEDYTFTLTELHS